MTAVDQAAKDYGQKIGQKIGAPQAKPDSTGSSVAYQVAQNTMTQLPVLGPAISAIEGLFGVKPGKPLGDARFRPGSRPALPMLPRKSPSPATAGSGP